MKTQTKTVLNIKLKGDNINDFKSAIKKIATEQKTIGFNKLGLSESEQLVIKKLSEKIN